MKSINTYLVEFQRSEWFEFKMMQMVWNAHFIGHSDKESTVINNTSLSMSPAGVLKMASSGSLSLPNRKKRSE